MKYQLTFLLVIFFATVVFGQKFIPGSIITNEGVKIDGFIKNTGAIERSELVYFKKSIDGAIKTYYPENLSGYCLGVKIHKTISIQLSGESLERKLFVKVLIDGSYIDLFRLDYQIRESPGISYQYYNTFYFYKLAHENEIIKLQDEDWSASVSKLKNDCLESYWYKKDRSYKFTEEGLSKFAFDYNVCMGEIAPKDYSEKPMKQELIYGIAAGGANTSIETGHPALQEFNYSSQLNPAIAFFIEFPVLKRHAWLQQGISYYQKSTSGNKKIIVNEFYENEGEEIILNSDISLSYLSFYSRLKYRYEKGPLRPYVFVGGYLGLRLNGKADMEREYFYLSETTGNAILDKEPQSPYNLNKFGFEDFGYQIGMGIDLFKNGSSKIFTEFFYSSGANFKNTSLVDRIDSSSYGVMLGYMF